MIRIAQVGPVATSIPPPRSSSVELMTSLLTEGLVAAGHQVTLFATGTSRTSGSLHATFPRGYADDPSLWPWEACELFNIAAAVECASRFDLIHCQAMYWPMALPFSRLCPTPLVQTLHHAPTAPEVALWSRYPDVPFIAISREQARLVDYFRDRVAPLVDGSRIVYLGEVDHAAKVTLLGGARALLYPVQSGEPFGLVLAEAMACGTPVAALDRGAVREVVEDGITGRVFGSIAEMIQELPAVLALDRAHVRRRAEERFGIARMVQEYVALYEHVIASARAPR
jgi:glycosyltransferase involved in cell wall biosynthesis